MTRPTNDLRTSLQMVRSAQWSVLSGMQAARRMCENDGQVLVLYFNHFLSTWNERSYEFAAGLFIASAFPDSLGPASWLGISISLSVIVFASSLGRWVDGASDRLGTLLQTIAFNRIVLTAAYLAWMLLMVQDVPDAVLPPSQPTPTPSAAYTTLRSEPPDLIQHRSFGRHIFLIALFLLGILERLSRMANLFCIERDWVPTLALSEKDSDSDTNGNTDGGATLGDKRAVEFDLTELNAGMSRIDLICKLISRIFVTGLATAIRSYRLTALVLLGMNIAFFPLEWLTARRVWAANNCLQQPKVNLPSNGEEHTHQMGGNAATRFAAWTRAYATSLAFYFGTPIWTPSLAVTSLHFTVFTFSGVLLQFLLHVGFTPALITIGEVVSAIFELSSTLVFPWGVHRFARRKASAYIALQETDGTAAGAKRMHDGNDGNDSDEDGGPTSFAGANDVTGVGTRTGSSMSDYRLDQVIAVSRVGVLAMLSMLVCILPAIPAIWALVPRPDTTRLADTGFPRLRLRESPPSSSFLNSTVPTAASPAAGMGLAWSLHPLPVLIMLVFVSASRLGRWTAVLSTQQLAQSSLACGEQSTFAGTEASFASTFGLAHYVATAIWSSHADFPWITVSTLLLASVATSVVWAWYRRQKKGEFRRLSRVSFSSVSY